MIRGKALVAALWLRLPLRVLAAVGAVIGLAVGWLAHSFLDPRFDPGPMAIFVGLVTHFPRTAVYFIGFAFAWRLAGDYGRDAASGWTAQYLAAGGTRDRYIVALTMAAVLQACTVLVVTVVAWCAVVSIGGAGMAPWFSALQLLPPGALWITGACSLVAVLVCAALRPGTAQASLLLLYFVPLMAIAMNALRSEAPPAVAVWLFRLTPPGGLGWSANALLAGLLYVALALGAGWLLAGRVLRVR